VTQGIQVGQQLGGKIEGREGGLGHGHQASSGGSSFASAFFSLVASPVRAKPRRVPLASLNCALTLRPSAWICHSPSVPGGIGATTTGHTGVLIATGMGG